MAEVRPPSLSRKCLPRLICLSPASDHPIRTPIHAAYSAIKSSAAPITLAGCRSPTMFLTSSAYVRGVSEQTQPSSRPAGGRTLLDDLSAGRVRRTPCATPQDRGDMSNPASSIAGGPGHRAQAQARTGRMVGVADSSHRRPCRAKRGSSHGCRGSACFGLPWAGPFPQPADAFLWVRASPTPPIDH